MDKSLSVQGNHAPSKCDAVRPSRLSGRYFRAYATREQAALMTLAQFKDNRFAEDIDQVPGEIAGYHDMVVEEFLATGVHRQRELWEEAFGDIAEESYSYTAEDREALPEPVIDIEVECVEDDYEDKRRGFSP